MNFEKWFEREFPQISFDDMSEYEDKKYDMWSAWIAGSISKEDHVREILEDINVEEYDYDVEIVIQELKKKL